MEKIEGGEDLVCGMRVSKRVGKRSDSAALESGLLLLPGNKNDARRRGRGQGKGTWEDDAVIKG